MLFTRLVKIHQPIFLRSAQSIIEKLNYKRWILCSWQRGQTNPFRHFALRNDSPPFFRLAGEGGFRYEPSQSPTATALPSGRALGRTGRFRPHSSTARRSQLVSAKLFASAKASPFRERWHGEAVTERVSPRLAAALGECFPNRSRGKIGKSVCAKREHPLRRLLPSGASHGRNVNKK